MDYLDGGESELNVEDIRGIWVASDDSGVVERIKEIAPSYLPNVESNAIFWASGGVEGGPEILRTATRTDKEVGGGEQDIRRSQGDDQLFYVCFLFFFGLRKAYRPGAKSALWICGWSSGCRLAQTLVVSATVARMMTPSLIALQLFGEESVTFEANVQNLQEQPLAKTICRCT